MQTEVQIRLFTGESETGMVLHTCKFFLLCTTMACTLEVFLHCTPCTLGFCTVVG